MEFNNFHVTVHPLLLPNMDVIFLFKLHLKKMACSFCNVLDACIQCVKHMAKLCSIKLAIQLCGLNSVIG